MHFVRAIAEGLDPNQNKTTSWRPGGSSEHHAAMEEPISAGVIPARKTPEGWKVLILRAYRNWDFPKGVIDPGEEPLAAAKREAAEEAAYEQGMAEMDSSAFIEVLRTKAGLPKRT
ncbi:MAG TPA: NUDIX domain-containing protein [Sinorhizobium sp.]|nr:NUDIX domain-containing protein [Sinorhizobium sp.]